MGLCGSGCVSMCGVGDGNLLFGDGFSGWGGSGSIIVGRASCLFVVFDLLRCGCDVEFDEFFFPKDC